MEDAAAAESDEGRSLSVFIELPDAAAFKAPRLNGVYLLLVDIFCCDSLSDIGGGQLGRESANQTYVPRFIFQRESCFDGSPVSRKSERHWDVRIL